MSGVHNRAKCPQVSLVRIFQPMTVLPRPVQLDKQPPRPRSEFLAKAVQRGSRGWTVSSAVEHRLDMAGATGSIPVPSTIPEQNWALSQECLFHERRARPQGRPLSLRYVSHYRILQPCPQTNAHRPAETRGRRGCGNTVFKIRNVRPLVKVDT